MSLDSKCTIASRLAKFLRKNGDKVIDGSCKLSLTTSALCLLNTLFWDVLDNEGRYTPDISAVQEAEVVEDIQFLYSFMKRTTSLKLFHENQTLRGGIDLSHFSNLAVLELRKIPAHLIISLDLLSDQLKALICSRSIYLLKELFACFMDGPNVVKTWTELKELNLSCNYLESLDQSLRSLPNLEMLDISHNHITNAEEIKVLQNLCFVNLNFNELNHLPVFSTESCRRLTKLYLKNNNLEDLAGLECFFNLEDLDVGYNLLSEYYVLSPLNNLKSLRVLNLEGNPLYFHKRHTVLVSAFINPYVLNRGLQLNGKLFAVPCALRSPTVAHRSESSDTFHHQTSINTVVGDAESTTRAPETCNLPRIPSEESEFDDNSISSIASRSGTKESALIKTTNSKKFRRKSSSKKKVKKMREALINEPVVQNDDKYLKSTPKSESVPIHVQARYIIETRRKERGENWLISDIAQQNLNVPANTPVVSSVIMQVTSQTALASKVTAHPGAQNSHTTDTDNISIHSSTKELVEILDIEEVTNDELPKPQLLERERCSSGESDDIEILASNSGNCMLMKDELSTSKDNLSDGDIYGGYSSVYANIEQSGEDSEEESEDSIFFVERLDDSMKQALSVTVRPKYIREKDVMKGKYLENLDLSSLVSVNTALREENGDILNEVHLEFDSVNSSKQKRIYLMENAESAEGMSKILQPFADAKTLKDVTVGALECLKCNSQFSKQAAHKILIRLKKPLHGKEVISNSYDSGKEMYPLETNACPNCGNHILVEMETVPLPTVAMPSGGAIHPLISTAKKTSDRSPDTLSTGSASSGSFIASLFSSIKLSPLLKRKSVPNMQVDPRQDSDNENKTIPITANQSQNNESQTISPETLLRRNSSDITIISNPSQNSIALFPDPTMEINLNTIIERLSQASLSPTISHDTTVHKIDNSTMYAQHPQNTESRNCDTDRKEYPTSCNGEDQDFYSFTESLADQSEKPYTEVMSSGSENYRSPSKVKPDSTTEMDENSLLITILGEKTIISHDMFSELDHRIKLHLEFNVFGKEEEFEACLQTSIVPLSTGDEFKGLFVVSSKKLYIIKFLPNYNININLGEPIEKVIQVIHACSLINLRQVKVILGNQGLTIACGANSHVHTLVIRDADICNSFSSLMSDLIQEPRFEFGKVEFFTSTSETLKQLQISIFSSRTESDEVPEVLSHIFAFWCKGPFCEKDNSLPVCIIITQDDIFITRILYKKQDSCSDLNKLSVYHYTEIDHQKISDLISLDLKKDLRSVEVNFMNESLENSDSTCWTITMETKSSLFSFINAVKGPWEEVFKVPLSLSIEEGILMKLLEERTKLK